MVGFKTTITENRSTTIVDLDMALDSQGIDIAKRDIEDAIAGIRTFPAEMTDEPMVGKIIPGSSHFGDSSRPTESVRRDALNIEKSSNHWKASGRLRSLVIVTRGSGVL